MAKSVIEIDGQRSVTVNVLEQGAVLLVEDPHSVAVVEMTPAEVDAVVEALQKPYQADD